MATAQPGGKQQDKNGLNDTKTGLAGVSVIFLSENHQKYHFLSKFQVNFVQEARRMPGNPAYDASFDYDRETESDGLLAGIFV